MAITGCNETTISETNLAPVVDNIPPLTVGKDQDFSFAIKAEDSENLSYRLDERAPDWINIDSNTGVLSVDSSQSVEGLYF
nr:hypothetical protein [Vibrio alfacsensis]